VGEGDVGKAVGDISGATDGRNLHIAIIVAEQQVAANVSHVDATERCGHGGGCGVGERHVAVAADDVCGTLNVASGDAAETIAEVQGAFNVRRLYGAVVVIYGDIPGSAGQLDAAEGVIEASGTQIVSGERAVAVLDV